MRAKMIILALALCIVLPGSLVIAEDQYRSYSSYDYKVDRIGEAFYSARYNQILNPDAGMDLEPVEGMEGDAAAIVHQKYVGSLAGQAAGGGGGTLGYQPSISSAVGGGAR